MKQQQNNRLWQVLMVCFSLATIAIFRPVEIVETDREIVITWPLPPELAAMHAYKPDYTARAFLDKKTKEVRFLTGG